MKKTVLLSIFFLIFQLLANDILREYRFVREAKSDGVDSETLAIRFDNEFYKYSNEDYSNILIFDADGIEVPFAVRDLMVKGGDTCVGRITDFRRDIKRNTAEIELTLPHEMMVNSIEFSTSVEYFDKHLSLTFFDEQNRIVRRNEDLKLFRYGSLYGSSIVKFERVKAKKIQIEILNFLEKKELDVSSETISKDSESVTKNIRTEEFEIKKITVRDDIANRRIFLPAELSAKRSEEGNNTVVIFDACRVPLESLTVRAAEKHYSRPAKLEFIDVDGKITHIDGFVVADDEKNISLNGRRAEKLRLVIFNGDNAPLKNLVFKWTAPAKIILAESRNGKDLKIYYGGNAAKQSYDIEKYAEKILFGIHSFYTPGESQNAVTYDPEPPKEKIVKYTLWLVIGIVILLLAVVIIKLIAVVPASEEIDK